MQQQDNHQYPFLYQRQTCHQVQPHQATHLPYPTLFRSRASWTPSQSWMEAAWGMPYSRPSIKTCQYQGLKASSSASAGMGGRSEEHTSELQSRPHLVCRLLPEKKNTFKKSFTSFSHSTR